MRLSTITLLIGLAAVSTQAARAATIELASPSRQAALIELYTSEGCNSCPPADRRLSRLKHDPRLWRELVPVAFHVDYWNRLGWRDRFSDARYSARQSDYHAHNYLKVIYTPGWVHDGRESRAWFSGRQSPPRTAVDVGVLKATINASGAGTSAVFTPAQPLSGPLVLNVALLGFDLVTDVTAGENTGKRLAHDFVVLALHDYQATGAGGRYDWPLTDLAAATPANATGIALWVTAADDPTPLQATGGWLR
jgi:hypothetical protein